MKKPALQLPLLARREAELETCAYCPKLCRAACPVSNAEPRETLIPWGKMTTAFHLARGDVPMDASHAAPAWACTGCLGCRELCDHKNEVAPTLLDARADLFEASVAPAAATRIAANWALRSEIVAAQTNSLAERTGATTASAKVALLVGCAYVDRAPEVAADAVFAARTLVGEDVRLVASCCGAPLLHAGDRRGFEGAARALGESLRDVERVLVVDPGCARVVQDELPRLSVATPKTELFVDLAEAALARLAPASTPGPVRYHDPCQLGRGLGRYEGPRRILQRVTGAPPRELPRSRERGACSGAGGLLPVTLPETSRAIADAVLAEHHADGGGTLVTACASSLRRFRSRGEDAVDLVTLVARALRGASS